MSERGITAETDPSSLSLAPPPHHHSGDAREVHDMATLLGYGADGICPYVAYEALIKMNHEGHVKARAQMNFTDDELIFKYRKALAKGILKVMSKMGISTLQSYKGAQVRWIGVAGQERRDSRTAL